LKYLKGRPDLDHPRILNIAKFSQSYARQQFLKGLDAPSNVDHQAAQGASGTSDASVPHSAQTDIARDEEIARAMQAAFDDEAGFALQTGAGGVGGLMTDGDSEDDEDLEDDDDDDDDDDDGSDWDPEVGEVAAGGWRMREAAHDEDMAREEDVECLELREVFSDPDLPR
jgi:hypothetical protein